MSKNKAKKAIKFFRRFKDVPIIGKGMEEEAKRRERKYNKHRSRNK